jgi:outer membrane lipoprotein carrier protein
LILALGLCCCLLPITHHSLRSSFAEAGPFDAIKKTYASINTLDARFQQKIHIASLKREREFAGTFLFKRGKGFLWNYTAPKEKQFLYDGRFIWQDEADKSFVTKDRVNKEKTGGTFLDLVEDMAAMDELFVLKSRKKEADMDVLELSPKKEGTINKARLWIDGQNILRKIEIDEFTGNVNTIEFSSVKVNQPVADGRFVFRAPKGKEVIER